MRIISGQFKGRRIIAPGNLPVRPTTDFAKEGLFNVLNNQYYFDELRVLDLYSGIGSITFEFASRGSQKIISVDKENRCVKFLTDTVEKLNLEDIVTVVREDSLRFLENYRGENFDVIFADPFYDADSEEYLRIREIIFERNLLKEEGCLILEHPKEIKLEEEPGYTQTRKYGHVHFSFFEPIQ